MSAQERPLAVVPAANADMMMWTREQLDLLKRTLVPSDITDDEFELFVHVSRHRRLDPFAKQIYAVRRGRNIVHQTGIDGFRLIAQRTGQYAGQDGPYWCGPDGRWRDVWLRDEPPAAARVGALRAGFAAPVYSVARWSSYAQPKSEKWQSMPDLMIAKCAEALALRRAFPEELSGLYVAEEMDQADRETAPAQSHTQQIPQTPSGRGNGPSGGRISERQIKYLHVLAREANWERDDVHNAAVWWYGVEHTDELTSEHARDLIDRLQQKPPRPVHPDQQPLDMSGSAPIDVIDSETGEIIQATPRGRNPSEDHPATDKQIREIFAVGRAAGWADAEIKAALYQECSVERTRDLTIGQASAFIEFLRAGGSVPEGDSQQALGV